MSKLLVKHTGAMIRADNIPFVPDISPGIQGRRAYDLLTTEQKAQLKIALNNAAKVLKCSIADLEWSFGRGHPVQPIRIRKTRRIEL